MADGRIELVSANKLINDSNESIDELDATIQTITRIYETFDVLNASWTGEKATQYKKTIQEARNPLIGMCKLAQVQSQKLNNVGNIIRDYHRK